MLAHASALLRGTPEHGVPAGRRPRAGHHPRQASSVLDFGRPVALSLIALRPYGGAWRRTRRAE
ncbi:hypothetical protein [Streptomyces sp. NPDC001843]|uniref:hypothetical protein n=1 Tax=Streptomyces sp. NPDC001843 TaxID=3364617 RepID=UPI00367C5F93